MNKIEIWDWIKFWAVVVCWLLIILFLMAGWYYGDVTR